MPKIIIIIIDSLGVGALPDAPDYGDEGCNTLLHITETVPKIKLPNLARLGLGRLVKTECLKEREAICGAYGIMAELSRGKDTTTGHWEIAGLITTDPMPTFPQGFPPELIKELVQRIGRPILGNKAASGTEIIQELGEEHLKTGHPIVYTSADSVLQIAAHEEVIPLQELYTMCEKAREMLTGPWAVGRVIARPFKGEPGKFMRTPNRHDYSLPPPRATVLDALKEEGFEVIGVGKISDIFAGQGLTKSLPSKSNREGMELALKAWAQLQDGLVFVNLVEFDSLYGHRNDPAGYALALEEFDRFLPELAAKVKKEGVLIITADHGNDPTTPSTDHSREYVPLLVYGQGVVAGTNLGVRRTFADVAATLAELFGLSYDCPGVSFLSRLKGEG